MAAQLDEKITTFFLGNSTNLVQETEKAKKAVGSLQKALTQRVNVVKGSILDPGSLVGTGFEKTLGTISGKLKPGAAGSSVLSGVAGSLGAAGAVLVKTFTAANNLAGMNADRMHDLSETMRQTSRLNMFASSVDGLDSLKEKYANTRSLILEAKQTQKDVDPFGFGGGVRGNMLTSVGNAQMSLKNAVGLGPYSNFDREKDEAATLELRKRIAEQEAFKLRRAFGEEQGNQLNLTRTRLTGSSSDVRLAELDRDRQRELNGLKGTDLNSDANRSAIEQRYGEQMSAERENKYFTGRHNQRDTGVAGIEGSLVGEEQKRAGIANVNLAAVREELRERKYLTVEARQTLQVEELRAQNEVRAANLAVRRHRDEVAAGQLDIAGQREIVSLGRQDVNARLQRAELNVRAAQAALNEAHGEQEYATANEQLKQAVVARVQLEKESAALTHRKYNDDVAAARLSIANQRELVALGSRGFEAQVKQADLNVQAAQAAVEQANSAEEYLKANERLKQTVADRVNLEKISVATQRAAADISFGQALRLGRINSTNSSGIAKRAESNETNMAAMRAEYSLPGTSEARKRELVLGMQGGENERRELLQERAYGKSPAQIMRSLQRDRVNKLKRDQFDARMGASDGLINISRDINGNAISGIDILTGQRRKPHSGNLASLLNAGHDTDVSAGTTALSAAKAQVEATNISNAYLKQMQMDMSNLAAVFAGGYG